MPDDKLKALAKKKRERPGSETLEDALICSIGDTVGALIDMHTAAGVSLTSIELQDGTTVEVKIPVGATDWLSRLGEIRSAAEWVCQMEGVTVGETEVADRLLDVDGWILNEYTVKTPAWMVPHAEVLWADLPTELEWVWDVQNRRKSEGS